VGPMTSAAGAPSRTPCSLPLSQSLSLSDSPALSLPPIRPSIVVPLTSLSSIRSHSLSLDLFTLALPSLFYDKFTSRTQNHRLNSVEKSILSFGNVGR
jgi:hypothetical protein